MIRGEGKWFNIFWCKIFPSNTLTCLVTVEVASIFMVSIITVIYLHGLKNQLAIQNYLESQVPHLELKIFRIQPEPDKYHVLWIPWFEKVEKHWSSHNGRSRFNFFPNPNQHIHEHLPFPVPSKKLAVWVREFVVYIFMTIYAIRAELFTIF